LGWWTVGRRRHLLVGLNVVEELVRYTQGDPDKVRTYADKSLWKTGGHERSTYLYDDNIVPGYELTPWADRLGFMLVQLIAAGSGLPLFSPLPKGARGGVLLTGDDDTALLKKYDEQLKLIDGFPITYLLLPGTNHNAETLARLPANVELGVHIDALEQPDRYDAVCRAQTKAVRALAGRSATTVRNHGHLNSGYWGHLAAWEECGLAFDLNNRGLDGTCPTGSYLPFQVRRPDGSWSNHFSLFSTFSDSMLYMQRWSEDEQIRCIVKLADQIDSTLPGVLVFNCHPENVSDGYLVHRAIMDIGRRRGWIALGAESYADWLQTLSNVRLFCQSGRLKLQSSSTVENLALSWPSLGITRTDVLPRWQGEIELSTRFE
jgi:hypothetical protein